MSRRIRHTTRVGAIPASMEPASTPNRAFAVRMNGLMHEATRAYDAAVYDWWIDTSALHAYYGAHDSVALFAESHPPRPL